MSHHMISPYFRSMSFFFSLGCCLMIEIGISSHLRNVSDLGRGIPIDFFIHWWQKQMTLWFFILGRTVVTPFSKLTQSPISFCHSGFRNFFMILEGIPLFPTASKTRGDCNTCIKKSRGKCSIFHHSWRAKYWKLSQWKNILHHQISSSMVNRPIIYQVEDNNTVFFP